MEEYLRLKANTEKSRKFIGTLASALELEKDLLKNGLRRFIVHQSASESRALPIGDQVAALALALQNDKTTAMRIPLLAQFIVSPREALRDVYQFSEEGVVMEDDVYMEDYEEPKTKNTEICRTSSLTGQA